MSDQMPMFDDPVPQQQPPKKRRKPVKKQRKLRKVAPIDAVDPVPAPRKRRKVAKVRANGHAGGRYTKAQYSAIGALLEMSAKERTAVIDIVKGLSK